VSTGRQTVGVVTGAAQGMGQACAVRVLDLVDTVVLVDRNETGVVEAAKNLADRGAAVEPFVLDITDIEGVARLAARVSDIGELRAVAHAAGVSPTMADWRRVLTVDLIGTAMLIEAFWPLTVRGTAMVCFASMAPFLIPEVDPALDAVLDDPLGARFFERMSGVLGEAAEDPWLAYAWAKRGVHRLVRREAVRFGPVGARINSVSPGIIDTPMGRQEAAARPTNDLLEQATPLGRQGAPREVAAATSFLLSDEASFVNGIDLLVDGGVVAAVGRLVAGG
jgi:NAD(P)-dependent dehydrogenase (short-subunit alcohol dehydrogenase family)